MTEPTERYREMAEAIVIEWTTDRFEGLMDDRDCEALGELIAEKLAAVHEKGRREATQWQPIETAPRDGSRILLFPFCVAHWDWGDESWVYAVTDIEIVARPPGLFYCSYAENPTHWMPLPEPPR